MRGCCAESRRATRLRTNNPVLRARPYTRAEAVSTISHVLPKDMGGEQQKKHGSYLLQTLRKRHHIDPMARGGDAKWVIDE